MAELENSIRSLLQATYTPIQPEKKDELLHVKLGRAWEKWGFVAALRPSGEELKQVKNRFELSLKRPSGGDPPASNDALKCIELIESTLPRWGTPEALQAVGLFRNVKIETLVQVAENLITLREEHVDSAIQAQASISDAFLAAQARPIPTPVAVDITRRWERVAGPDASARSRGVPFREDGDRWPAQGGRRRGRKVADTR